MYNEINRNMRNKRKAKAVIIIEELSSEGNISRKEALKKAGYYAATSVVMMQFLGSPLKSMAASPAPPPPW